MMEDAGTEHPTNTGPVKRLSVALALVSFRDHLVVNGTCSISVARRRTCSPRRHSGPSWG